MPRGPALGLGRGSFKGWQAWRIKRGPLELAVVPEVGGRIMGLSWRGHQLAFVHPKLAGRTEATAVTADMGRAQAGARVFVVGRR